MAYPPNRNFASNLRQSSFNSAAGLSSSQQSPALEAKINEKRQELEHLIALRDLSAGLASQLERLEEKLSILTDGTEGRFLDFYFSSLFYLLPPARAGGVGGEFKEQLRNDFCTCARNNIDRQKQIAVAAVLANWHSVLQAIAMASAKIPKPKSPADDDPFAPRPPEDQAAGVCNYENGVPMPQTLVRMPVLQRPEQ
ncbi:DASH complex subunit dad2 [Rhizina undulata]